MAGEVAVEAEGGSGNSLGDRVAAFGQALDKSVMSFGNVAGRLGEFGGALEKAGGIVGTVAKQFVERLSTRIGEYFTNQLNKVFDKIIDPVVKIVAAIFDPLFDIVGAALLPLQKELELIGSLLQFAAAPLSALAQIIELMLKPLDVVIALVDAVAKSFGTIVKVFEAFMAPFDEIIKIIELGGQLFEKGIKLLLSPLQLLAIPLKAIEIPMRMFGRLVDEATKLIERFANGVLAPIKALESLQGKAHDAVNGVFDTLDKLASDPIGGFNAAISAISGFVAAIDPSVIQMFDAAARDLAAVIGEALRPAMYVAVEVVRTFAGTLRPLLQSIAPEIQKLTKAFGTELVSLIPVFVNYLRELMPFLKEYIENLSRQLKDSAALSQTLQAYRKAVEAVTKPIYGFIDSLIPARKTSLTFIQTMSRATIAVMAFVAKLFGATSAFNAIKESIGGKAGGDPFSDATGLAVANNPSFKSIEQMGKDIQQAAFVASGQNQDNLSAEDKFRAAVLRDLDSLQGMNLREIITDGVKAAFNGLSNPTQVVRSIQERTGNLWKSAMTELKDLLPG